MSESRWCVVIVRGWVDGADLKVRMLASGDVEGVLVRGSVAAATDQLAAWLSSLLSPALDDGGSTGGATGDGPETPQ